MLVKVKFFASCRELAGTSSIDLELSDASTTNDLVIMIQRLFPSLHNITGEVSIAVNKKYVKEPVVLKSGDEIALIPPISGG